MKPTPFGDRVLIEHMLSCLSAIDEFTEGDPQRYLTSRLVRDAVLRNLQTLTESSQRLSEEIKARYPGVPWKKLAGFRNLLVHDYLGGIDDQAVLLVLENNLTALQLALYEMRSAVIQEGSVGSDGAIR